MTGSLRAFTPNNRIPRGIYCRWMKTKTPCRAHAVRRCVFAAMRRYYANERKDVMEIAVYLLKSVSTVILLALLGAMLVRAVLSWFPSNSESTLDTVVFTITEPFIVPVRTLLERIEWVRNAPIDVSFFVTFLIISLIFDAIS